MRRIKNRKPRAPKVKQVNIRVSSAAVAVPMERVESYFNEEIAREGRWRSDVVPCVLFPRAETGKVSGDWFRQTLEQMRAARASAPPKLMDFGSGHLVDIGLIDIQVFFDGPMDLLVEQLKTDSTRFLDENLKHVDWLCSRVFHDQMVLVFACHVFTAGGDRRVHYHNVIFGLRKEIRDGHELIGPLDMEPLVRALDRRIRVGLVAGIAS